VRAGFVASQHAVRQMLGRETDAPPRPNSRPRGLIVHLSHWAAQKRIGNAIYGVSKAATDKMVSDMAEELRGHGISVVSLYPGLVRTEAVMAAAAVFDLSNSESPEFIGRAVAALAGDDGSLRWTGRAVTAAQIALEYGFTDVDGKQPRPLTLADV
jgi:NAD(P)-dependent dehydrogenase (short-subunit alcohol dehydrogenase family)